MSFLSIHEALDAQLKTVVNLPPLQEENIRVKLGAGTKAWSRSTLIPNRSDIVTVGVNGLTELNGLYQIDLMFPADDKYTNCTKMADLVLAAFSVGLQLNTLMIRNSYPAAGYATVPGYYTIPVIVEWSMWVNR
jgi:hypothetical protein